MWQHAFLVMPKHGPDYREKYEISQQKIKTRIYFTQKPLKSSSGYRVISKSFTLNLIISVSLTNK